VDLSSGVITVRVNTEKNLLLADLKSSGKTINILQSFTFTTVQKDKLKKKFSELNNVGFIHSKL
jgi:hypothetical protein